MVRPCQARVAKEHPSLHSIDTEIPPPRLCAAPALPLLWEWEAPPRSRKREVGERHHARFSLGFSARFSIYLSSYPPDLLKKVAS